jgi:hypothetical protein
MKKIYCLVSVMFFILAGLFLLPQISLAANNLDVVINEISWMGNTTSTSSEWIELYNNTSEQVDLSGWSVVSQDGTPTISLSGFIQPGQYFLLERTSDDSVPQVVADLIYIGALNNSGEFLELKDGDGNIIDSIDSSSGWHAGDNTNKLTMERINPSSSAVESNWQNSNVVNGTPRSQNSVYAIPNMPPVAQAGDDIITYVGDQVDFDASSSYDSDGVIVNYLWDFGDGNTSVDSVTNHIYNNDGIFTVYLLVEDDNGATSTDGLFVEVLPAVTPVMPGINYGDLIINEFVADPISGEEEWIEIYNTTTSTIDLSDVSIEDGVGSLGTLAGEVLSNDFYVFNLSSSYLNNSGDVIAIKQDDNIIDSISYGDWDDGNISDNAPTTSDPNSIARDVDIFLVTITPTKGSENIITPEVIDPPTSPPPTNTGGGTTYKPIYYYNQFDIVINEFVSDPADGDVEWIELYNNTDSKAYLDNLIIEDGSGQQTKLLGTISSHNTLVIENPKGNLNNSGDLIILIDSHNNIIDSVSYGSWEDDDIFDNALVASDPDSVARFVDGQSTGNNYSDFRITTTPTKGLPNIINGSPEEIAELQIIEEADINITYLDLMISELLPNPDGSDIEGEFIEIFNPHDTDIDLSYWSLDDIEGGSKPYVIKNTSIEPGEYLIFSRQTTGLALNNTSDSVRFFNPLNIIVDQVSYSGLKKDQSYIRVGDQWQITSVPTPGEENQQAVENINISSRTSQSTSTNKSGRTTISGTVSVEPGLLGSQIFYITNTSAKIYSYKKDFPELQVGDEIEVTGEWSQGAQEMRFKISSQNDIKVIGNNNTITPIDIDIADVGEDLENELVRISGEIIEISGSYVFVTDGIDEVRVYLKRATGISKLLFTAGDQVEVVGIVSEISSGHRLLPRNESDINITGSVAGEQEEAAIYDNNNWWHKYAMAIMVFIILVLIWLSRDKIKLLNSDS